MARDSVEYFPSLCVSFFVLAEIGLLSVLFKQRSFLVGEIGMQKLIWVGPRESDILHYTGGIFSGSITAFGCNKNGNWAYCHRHSSGVRPNHNVYSDEYSNFIVQSQKEILVQYGDDCRFLSYNPNYVFHGPPEIIQRTLCLNDQELMERLNDKIQFRQMVESSVPMLTTTLLPGVECSYERLHERPEFSSANAFVVQKAVSCGGEGTFVLTSTSSPEIVPLLEENTLHLVSVYHERNIPVNMHIVIYDEEVVLLPPSIQIIIAGRHRLLYRGADYASFASLSDLFRNAFEDHAIMIGQILRKKGYRGVLGLDAMILDNGVFIQEINNRFQGSTPALNRALWESGFPSVQQLHLESFSRSTPSKNISAMSHLRVPYSSLVITNDWPLEHTEHFYQNAHAIKKIVDFFGDGYRPGQIAETSGYLFHALFSGPLTFTDPENLRVTLHPHTQPHDEKWRTACLKIDKQYLKVALLSQGISLDESAKNFFVCQGGAQIGVYGSLDLLIDGIRMNAPVNDLYTSWSPFQLRYSMEDGALSLWYYGNRLLPVAVDATHWPTTGASSRGIPIDTIAFWTTDRLRLQHSPSCIFGIRGNACGFCNVLNHDSGISEIDIFETIDICFREMPRPFKHIMIGGKSASANESKTIIIKMCERIRQYSNMPIYLMCLPPGHVKEIKDYFDAGVSEFGFNLEIFDRHLARKIMPGKGEIPLKQYMNAFSEAVALCGQKGAVRTAFVVGLEPEHSLLTGIETVCRIGVSPILSPFRPLDETPMAGHVPPSWDALLSITEKAHRIAIHHGLELGPQCLECQNNVLTWLQSSPHPQGMGSATMSFSEST